MAWGIKPSVGVGVHRARLLTCQTFERAAVRRALGGTCGDPKKLLLCIWPTRAFLNCENLFTRFYADRREAAFLRPLV